MALRDSSTSYPCFFLPWPRPQSGVKGSLSQSWTARSSGPASHDMDHKHPMQRKIGISQDATAQQQMKQRILSKTAQASPAQSTASRKSRTSQNHAKPQQTARATNGMARPAKVSILLGKLVVSSKSACVHLLKRSSSFCLSLSCCSCTSSAGNAFPRWGLPGPARGRRRSPAQGRCDRGRWLQGSLSV